MDFGKRKNLEKTCKKNLELHVEISKWQSGENLRRKSRKTLRDQHRNQSSENREKLQDKSQLKLKKKSHEKLHFPGEIFEESSRKLRKFLEIITGETFEEILGVPPAENL